MVENNNNYKVNINYRTSFDKDFIEKLYGYRNQMKSDLAALISINSVRDPHTIYKGAPFGRGIRKCFDKVMEFAIREGFKVKDFDGYAMHIEYGDGKDTLGILGHLDTVDAKHIEGWSTNPFEMVEKDGFWYGRGVNDDKGPVIGCFYILKVLKELNYKPNKKIRLILGGAEETTWECMEYYAKHNKMPDMGFSPDCDFPIVNCEKGIIKCQYERELEVQLDGINNIVQIKSELNIDAVCSNIKIYVNSKDIEGLTDCLKGASNITKKDKLIEIEYQGKFALSRNPHKGENAIFKFVDDFINVEGLNLAGKVIIDILNRYFNNDIYGNKLGLFHEDVETGKTTSNLAYVQFLNKRLLIGFDFRYPVGIDKKYILDRLSCIAGEIGMSFNVLKDLDLLYVPGESQLIDKLSRSYEKVTNERALLFTKGAASYARTMKNCVGFGPSFEDDKPNSHKANECINLKNFYKALEIYYEAIKGLTK